MAATAGSEFASGNSALRPEQQGSPSSVHSAKAAIKQVSDASQLHTGKQGSKAAEEATVPSSIGDAREGPNGNRRTMLADVSNVQLGASTLEDWLATMRAAHPLAGKLTGGADYAVPRPR